MGLTFAKSVRFGPVRFSFTGSGIGVSAGIPGLRLGVGPRGAYVAGGMGGFRYRQSLGGRRRTIPSSTNPVPVRSNPVLPDPLIVSSVEHEAKHVLELCEANADELVQSMNEQGGKADLWPFVLVALTMACFYLWNVDLAQRWPRYVVPLLVAASGAAVVFAYWRDRVRKLTVLFFEPDEFAQQRLDVIKSAVETAAKAVKLQSIATTARYGDTRYTAGATEGLHFGPASLYLGQAPGVAANLDVPILRSGKTTLAFFPDRVLAFQGKSVGAVNYGTLQAVSRPMRFVEESNLPHDATVVDHTWKYVNKNGTPDRRFKDNRQLPVCLYSHLELSTPSGLDMRFMASKDGLFDQLRDALQAAGS
jgi:hypothetical protein